MSVPSDRRPDLAAARPDARLAAAEDWSRGRSRHVRRLLTLASVSRHRPSPNRSSDPPGRSDPPDAERRIRIAQARLVDAVRAKAGHEPRAAIRKAGHSLDDWLAIANRTAEVIERTPVTLGRGPVYRVEEAVRDLLGEGDALLTTLDRHRVFPDSVTIGTIDR